MTTKREFEEREGEVLGVKGRFFGVVVADNGRILNQRFKTFSREYTEHGQKYRIAAELRFDDECRNGHETFSITADGRVWDRGAWRDSFGGCCHEQIAQHFPALAPLIPWHLCSTNGPMHYEANAVYLAGDRGCWGLRKGEGKARELDAARRVAVWPEATDAELMQEPETLRAALRARLPALLERFKAAMLDAGFIWPA